MTPLFTISKGTFHGQMETNDTSRNLLSGRFIKGHLDWPRVGERQSKRERERGGGVGEEMGKREREIKGKNTSWPHESIVWPSPVFHHGDRDLCVMVGNTVDRWKIEDS